MAASMRPHSFVPVPKICYQYNIPLKATQLAGYVAKGAHPTSMHIQYASVKIASPVQCVNIERKTRISMSLKKLLAELITYNEPPNIRTATRTRTTLWSANT